MPLSVPWILPAGLQLSRLVETTISERLGPQQFLTAALLSCPSETCCRIRDLLSPSAKLIQCKEAGLGGHFLADYSIIVEWEALNRK
ncbi:hypothetical protein EX30DRAFT_90418 [Ascodesmis nigricans]|uniref:Uncharacterized protein n=1 Tax=Ascodesmis nigricans TaxID=341454 RepID=A0A4S2N3N2_9PEZI|nr:hypothetical protein EX30DRAFT_90418 [Ascodesmis nigricans]